ncbi:MAG: YkgJ family cysteine cluster protein [Phycisphaerae bacterium]|nr:YkgJ family cysteine cluster protein [Phycisphaerae bacterium]
MSDEPLCQKCAGLCCRYIALPIDTPEDFDEFEDVRWYLAHEGISVFVEDDLWYINVATRCRFLGRDNLCGIYEERPRICRSYTEANCDFHSGDYGYDQYFTSIEEIDQYMKDKDIKPKKRK